jgi:uncharacterized membrane protein
MRFEFDPVWPWSEAQRFLTDTDAPVRVAVWLTALFAFVLPLVFLRLNSKRLRRQVLIAAGLWFVLVLYWIIRYGSPSSSTSLGERLRNCGLALLVVLPLGVVGWMIRVYLQSPGVPWRRLSAVLFLRLLAVLLAAAAVTRPYLGFPDTVLHNAVIWVLGDFSESMTIQDEAGQARWDYMLRTLRDCQPLLDRLRSEQGIDVEFYRFARETAPWQLSDPGKPDGKRTDIGGTLRYLFDQRDRRTLKGLFLLSDGRNNGSLQISPLSEARRWRKLGCPLHTVLLGNPNTPNNQRDITVTRVTPGSALIQIKSDLVALARIDAPGFEGFKVKVRVFLDGKEVPATVETLQRRGEDLVFEKSEDGIITLKDSRNNEVRLKLTAPNDPGEYKLTVKVEDPRRPGEALPEELNAANNEGSTLISVIRGGLSVLVVDRPRAFEAKFIYEVLRSDPRITPHMVWMGGKGPLDRSADDLFQFARKKYDVIILGDVTAEQIKQVNPKGVAEMATLVENGAGLVMLGGYSTFGNGDWAGTALEPALPLDLSVKGQKEDKVKMKPTEPGLRLFGYVLGLANGQKEAEIAAWDQLEKLDGIAQIKPRGGPLENVLAESEKGDPILVTQNYGKGRVLAFAGDSTWRWVRNPDTRLKHSRFWRQMVVWLARQELAGGNVWVRPDMRDIPLGTELGFSVGMRGKGGIDLPNGVYEVEVQAPGKQPRRVNTARSGAEDRGVFKPDEAGEYVIKVKGKAPDPAGGEVNDSAEARFLVHEEDVEMAEWSADKTLMDKLAKEGRGKAVTAAGLPDLLRELLAPSSLDGKVRLIPWPAWRSTERSSFLVLFFLIFVLCLSAEWVLRRRWGMV